MPKIEQQPPMWPTQQSDHRAGGYQPMPALPLRRPRQRKAVRWALGIFLVIVLLGALGGIALGPRLEPRLNSLVTRYAPRTPQNLIYNGSFEGYGGWQLRVSPEAAASDELDRATKVDGSVSMRVTVTRSKPYLPWNVQLRQTNIPVARAQAATLSFYAKSAAPATIEAVLQRGSSPYTVYCDQSTVLDTAWRLYRFSCTPTESDQAAILTFNLAEASGAVWLDDVRLAALSGSQEAPLPQPGQTAPPNPSGTPTPPRWTLIWNDEFNGTGIDTTKWNVETDAPGGHVSCCLADGLQYWSADNVAVQNGILRLTSEQRWEGGKRYTSGAVTTLHTFDFRYGRVDIRARLPKTQGMWLAFWMLPVRQTWQGSAPHEVDITELLGQNPSKVYMVNHWGAQKQWCNYTGPDFSADYHVFSLVWDSSSLTWYVDGIQRCEVSQGIPDEDMYLLLNTFVGGSWSGPPNATTVFPQYTDIDYVRVYKSAP